MPTGVAVPAAFTGTRLGVTSATMLPCGTVAALDSSEGMPCTQCEVLGVGKYSHRSYLLVVKH